MHADGISVDSVAMESHRNWIPASKAMTESLPLSYSNEDKELVEDGMFVSPKLLVSDERAVSIYRRTLAQTDMLMFNLHGSEKPDEPSFYSDDEAFASSELYGSSARVLGTVACYGARYLGGYQRSQSMLLQAIYGGGILLYTGALASVPMYENLGEDSERARLNPGTGSEVLMRLHALCLFQGMSAGKALLQAQCDYFNQCRHEEGDTFAMATALMFCLYGNPMLHVKRREKVVQAAVANHDIAVRAFPSMPMPLGKAMVRTIMTKEQLSDLKDIVDAPQPTTDSHARLLCAQVADHLYQMLGLPTQELREVSEVRRTHGSKTNTSYSFAYHNPDARFDADMFVEVNGDGKLERVYSSKS